MKIRNAVVVLAALVALAFFSPSAGAQTPRFDVFGGYSALAVNVGSSATNSGASTTVLHGGEVSVAVNFNSWFAIEGDVSAHHVGDIRTISAGAGPDATIVPYLFGPRIKGHIGRFEPFAHIVFGGARISTGGFGNVFHGSQDNAFAFAAGGGADLRLNRHIAVRVVQFDYLQTHFGSALQNHMRVSTGAVISF